MSGTVARSIFLLPRTLQRDGQGCRAGDKKPAHRVENADTHASSQRQPVILVNSDADSLIGHRNGKEIFSKLLLNTVVNGNVFRKLAGVQQGKMVSGASIAALVWPPNCWTNRALKVIPK